MKILSLVLFLTLILVSRSVGQEFDRTIEGQVKAAFLYNFTKFVVWPENSFEDPTAPVRIGVIGDNDLLQHLETVVEGKTVRGRPVVVSQLETLELPDYCHVAFVAQVPTESEWEAIAKLTDRSVLVVGHAPGFASRGGVINFVPNGTQMHLEINPTAAERRRLQISSRLLSLATLVSDPD